MFSVNVLRFFSDYSVSEKRMVKDTVAEQVVLISSDIVLMSGATCFEFLAH